MSAPFVVIVVGLLALAVAIGGSRPFYTQRRIGRHGKTYRIWKLQTMLPDADTLLKNHLAQDPVARAEWDQLQKLKIDPRVTPVGRLLRKSSLDELPQLWNVLIGDMSLVGPRPMMCSQQSLYPGQAYYDLKPGITGYWQISDRNETSFSQRASFDNRYAKDVSFKTDTSVLLETVKVVLRGTGC
jgi:lipopolysaccharide/colanic/teichoic acid biosynthesis glycosyltransferase